MRDLNKEFAQILSREMAAKGWNQSSLGAAAGISQSLIGSYVRAEVSPSLTNVEKIARALRKSIAQLFEESGESPPPSSVPQELLNALEACSSTQLSAIRALVSAFQPSTMSGPRGELLALIGKLDDPKAERLLATAELTFPEEAGKATSSSARDETAEDGRKVRKGRSK